MILAIDAGGTYIRLHIYEGENLKESISFKSKEQSLSASIEFALKKYATISDVVISYAGQVRDGMILAAPNREIEEANIKEYIEKKYGVKLFIQNDLYCALLAEAADVKSKEVCVVYLGTGLGLGVMSGGVALQGFSNVATELGHIPYKKAPFRCGCGKDNCIELFCSGIALLEWKKYYNLDLTLTLEELKNQTDLQAQEVYKEFEEAYLHALGVVVSLFNPEYLILGGGIIEKNNFLVEIAKTKLQEYALALGVESLKIEKSKISDAPLKGALLLKEENVSK